MNETQIQADFDEIARLSGMHRGRVDRYDKFLAGLVPSDARELLEVGCGLGQLAARLAAPGRSVKGIDLSPEMIARAKKLEDGSGGLQFLCGNFLEMEFPNGTFDCMISSAVLHHMPTELAVERMIKLIRPGGLLVVHDLRSAAGVLNRTSLAVAGVVNCLERLVRSGRLFQAPALREAWEKHGAGETYLSMTQVRALASDLQPSATVHRHWFWMYTIVWHKPVAA
jgi:2-polyprenyl-3-methyl-5-hydroxy-6-metoxy-1,4-benzoquinol methylase